MCLSPLCRAGLEGCDAARMAPIRWTRVPQNHSKKGIPLFCAEQSVVSAGRRPQSPREPQWCESHTRNCVQLEFLAGRHPNHTQHFDKQAAQKLVCVCVCCVHTHVPVKSKQNNTQALFVDFMAIRSLLTNTLPNYQT